MSFRDLKTTQKGYVGEAEVDKFLVFHGIIPYSPQADKAHPFDRLCATSDKKKIFIAECKSKASRTYYPDTGINVSCYNDYVHIREKYNIDVWLFFVDEHKKKIYGNLLTELEKPRTRIRRKDKKSITYPFIEKHYDNKDIIYFPLVSMIDVCELSDEVASRLKSLSTRNYEYAL